MPGYPYPWGGVTPPQWQPPTQMPMQPQPWSPQRQQAQQNQIDGVRWVNTLDEVNGTTLNLGSSALFMFTSEPAFAIKSVSPSGVPQVKVFDFHERQPVTPASYVTREEFDKLKEQLNGKPVVQQPAAAAAVNEPDAAHADGSVVPGNTGAGAAGVLQSGGGYGMDSQPAQ